MQHTHLSQLVIFRNDVKGRAAYLYLTICSDDAKALARTQTRDLDAERSVHQAHDLVWLRAEAYKTCARVRMGIAAQDRNGRFPIS